jgi:phage head maturation protease
METKMVHAEIKAVESDNPHGEFELVLSTPTRDRDGEVIEPKAFEPLPEHITIDIDHGLSTATTVGSGRPYYDGDNLMVRGTFSSIPRAQEVRTLVTEGHIRSASVAYMGAKKEEKDGIPHVTKAELLNGAIVPVPANRDALVVSAKGLVPVVELKPYANEHSCRLEDPGQFDRFRRNNDADPNVIIGFRKDGTSTAQAFRYPTADWTEARARAHCSDKGGTFEAAAKDADPEDVEVKAGARNSTKDTERLQAIHDLAVENGAQCSSSDTASVEAPTEKSASREDATGAGGDDEQQYLELRARALRLLGGAVT